MPTIGVEFATKTVTLSTGDKVKGPDLGHCWAGTVSFNNHGVDSCTSRHYRRAVGAIIMYDITKEKTFNNVRRWHDNVREYADADVVIMLVGNKADLPDRAVRKEDGKNVADQNGLLFEEISSKETPSVSFIFEKLLESIKGST